MTKAGTASGDVMIWIHMGQWPCYVGFTTSENSFKGVMKRLKIPLEDVGEWISPGSNATTHSLFKGNTSTYIVCIQPWKRNEISKEAYIALIAHECMHVVEFIRRDYSQGRPLGSEAEAYLIQYLVQEMLQAAWRTGRRKSIKAR